MTFQFHNMLILHPPPILIPPMPPIAAPVEEVIPAIPVVGDMLMPDIAMPVLVGGIDIAEVIGISIAEDIDISIANSARVYSSELRFSVKKLREWLARVSDRSNGRCLDSRQCCSGCWYKGASDKRREQTQ
jgi:hypothetical protein